MQSRSALNITPAGFYRPYEILQLDTKVCIVEKPLWGVFSRDYGYLLCDTSGLALLGTKQWNNNRFYCPRMLVHHLVAKAFCPRKLAAFSLSGKLQLYPGSGRPSVFNVSLFF